MRSRNLKPGFFKNEDLGQLPFEHRLLFAGLWCLADREGFFEYRPMRMAAELFPYDKKIDGKKIDAMMRRLMSLHVITCNEQFGYIPSFLTHNKPHPHESKSTVPEEIKNILKNQCNDMSLHVTPMSDDVALNEECGMRNEESLLLNTDAVTSEGSSVDSFQKFWTAYPKKVAKESARKAFSKLNIRQELLDAMLTAIKKQILSDQWTRDDGKYIPHPATWINGRRWEDDLSLAQLPRSQIPRPDPAMCAKHVRMSSRLKRWCEREGPDCEYAWTDVCRKLDAFPGVQTKDPSEDST